MKYLLLILGILFLPQISTKAQQTNHNPTCVIYSGLGYSNIIKFSDAKNGDHSSTNTPILSYGVGIAFVIKLSSLLYLQPGLSLISQGTKDSESGITATMRSLYHQLSTMAAVKFPTNSKAKWQVHGGFYLGIGEGGKSVVKDSDTGKSIGMLTFGNKSNSLKLNRFDWGMKYGAGVTIGNVFLEINQAYGLGNVAKNSIIEAHASGDIRMTNLNTMLNIGYVF